MSPLKEVGKLIGRGIERVVFGTETRGIVQSVKRDPNEPQILHVLVKTDSGNLRYFMEPHSYTRIGLNPPSIEHGEVEVSISEGERWDRRRWGKGMILLPGSPAERNPFNL